MTRKPITIVETSVFTRRVEKLLTTEEREVLIDYLATHPEAGDEIEGTGGVRVIYYFYTDEIPLYAVLIYGKNEQADLTPDQRKAVAAFAAAVKEEVKSRRRRHD